MNLDPIDYNYIDTKNNYPLQDYIDDKFNSIVIPPVTNIDSSNILINNETLNKILYFDNNNHLYLNNSNIFGEIRFKNIYTNNNVNRNHNVKIDNFGKLQVYHNYNILSPTVLEGWKDVEEEIANLIFGLQGQILEMVAVQTQIAGVNYLITTEIERVDIIQTEIAYLSTAIQGNSLLNVGYESAKATVNASEIILKQATDILIQLQKTQGDAFLNALIGVGVPIGIGAIITGIYSAIELKNLENIYSNVGYSNNSNFIENEATSNLLYYQGDEIIRLKGNLRSLNNDEGFINSNILTTQLIPSLNTNEIKINNTNVSNIFTTQTDFNNQINSIVGNIELLNDDLIETSNALYTDSLIPIIKNNKTFYLNSNQNIFNIVDNKLNIKSFNYIPNAPLPNNTNGTFTNLGNNFAYLSFTTNGTIEFSESTLCDLLIVGAGGRGGVSSTYGAGGGGGAGEVIYYPNFNIPAGSYQVQVGIDSSTPSNRISKIYSTTDLIFALGGGDGGGGFTLDIERRFPPKAYNTLSATTTTTFSGRTCYFKTINLTTADITYGSGTYEIYHTSLHSSSANNVSLLFNHNTTETTTSAHFLSGNYAVTTGALTTQGNNYYIVESAYRGDSVAIKLPIPIALTSFKIFIRSDVADRRPKNFKIYASNTGASGSWLNLLTITNASYTSGVYTNTSLSANTTPYLYYCLAVNALQGGTTSTILNFAEWEIYGKQILLNTPLSGGSGGGGGSYLSQAGANAGTPFNASFSKLNNGFSGNGTTSGAGGSATSFLGIPSRYIEPITGTNIEVGKGGDGELISGTPTTKTNYGDGGDGNGGLGYQGIILIKFPYSSEKTYFTGLLDYTKIENIPPQSNSKWFLTDNNIYNTNSGNVGIGTTNPNYKLDVIGDIEFTNNLYYNGSLTLPNSITGTATNLTGNPSISVSAINLNSTGNITGANQITATNFYGYLNGSCSGTSTGLSANPSISVSSINLNSGNLTNGGTITASSFSGPISGNATSATTSYRLNPYVNEWHISTDSKNRFYFGNNSRTYFGSQDGYEWRSSTDGNIMSLDNSGNLTASSFNGTLNGTIGGNRTIAGTITFSKTIYCNGNDTIGTNYTAGTGGLYSGTDYPQQADLVGFVYWGAGLNSTAVAKNISGTSHLISFKGDYALMGKGLISYSDRRIKTNEKEFLALPLIYHLKPKNYDYKENKANSFGFIAQDVDEILPQLVITGKGIITNDEGIKEEVENFKSIDYNQLIAINTQGIKELMELIKKLNNKVELLEEEVRKCRNH